ncbi:MAG: tetratricopeptide repeat protein [Elusimicrobia bacterium]|nr:tetratricopeptide repeat protein [Elusimicrobiota bacterium]
MPNGLTELCAAARSSPLAPRNAVYEALRGAEVAVIRADGDDPEYLELWADRDPVLGGLWIPVFSDLGLAKDFATGARRPAGPALQPVNGPAVELFRAALLVPCFAGLRLDPIKEGSTRLERHDVFALADGLCPNEAPDIHLFEEPLVGMPEETLCRFGEADPSYGPDGRRAVFPGAPGLSMHDFRCLSPLELGGEAAWVPCRNLAAALASAPDGAPERDDCLMELMVSFGMLGEAEVLCRKLRAEPARRPWALGQLGRVLRRAGRLAESIAHCRAALEEAPGEARLYRSLALAHAELDEMEEAAAVARRGLAVFPDEPTLRRFA